MVKKFQEFFSSKNKPDDEYYMRLALQSAERAKSKGDMAIGSVLAWNNKNLVEHNTIYSERDIVGFSEINVLRKASQSSIKRLDESVLYTTLEPNSLCALAAYWNGIREIVFGAYDDLDGFVSSDKSLDLDKWNISYKGGVLAKECYDYLSQNVKNHTRYE